MRSQGEIAVPRTNVSSGSKEVQLMEHYPAAQTQMQRFDWFEAVLSVNSSSSDQSQCPEGRRLLLKHSEGLCPVD